MLSTWFLTQYLTLSLRSPLWWVACTYDLLMYTGDIAFAEKYYHTIVNTLDKFYPSVTSPKTQLITKGVGISDSYGDYAFLGRTGAVTYFNALYVLALDNAAAIAKALGHRDDEARWTARARIVSDAINTDRWDSVNGVYFDGQCGDTPCPQHAQDGNSISIVSGVANQSRAESTLFYLSKNMARPYGNAFYDTDALGTDFSQRVYAFMSYFEIQARFLTGKVDSALDQIRRMYGHMSRNDPGITMWEGIGPNGLPYEEGFTSMAHGWSTGVVPALTNFLLGVRPTGPGFTTWSIKPHPGDVKWAKGEVPTPKGPMKVFWYSNADIGIFLLNVVAPAGTSGILSVPVRDSSSVVYVNTELVWEKKTSRGSGAKSDGDGYVSIEIQSGTNTVSVGFPGIAPNN